MSHKAFYELLGVDPKAKSDEIRKAYMKKALLLHPDKNPDNPKAKDEFQHLNHVYWVLKDDARRHNYDQYGETEADDGDDLDGPQCEEGDEDEIFSADKYSYEQLEELVHKVFQGLSTDKTKEIVRQLEIEQAYEPNPERLWTTETLEKELEKLENLKEMKRLDWSKHYLKDIPEEIAAKLADLLPDLETLILDSNQLQGLPDAFQKFTSLRVLSLKENKMKVLPAVIQHFKQLETLVASQNSLQTLPDFLGDLTHLKRLEFFGNQLKKLPDQLFANLHDLERIDLECNHLKALPNSLVALKATKLMALDAIVDPPLEPHLSGEISAVVKAAPKKTVKAAPKKKATEKKAPAVKKGKKDADEDEVKKAPKKKTAARKKSVITEDDDDDDESSSSSSVEKAPLKKRLTRTSSKKEVSSEPPKKKQKKE